MISNIIKNNLQSYYKKLQDNEKALLYYQNKNDILRFKSPANLIDDRNAFNPFRNADNRISHNWFNILVNQKAGYLFTYPPIFDVSDTETNKKIINTLGDNFAKVCKDLCIDASCYGKAYLHLWKDPTLRFTTIDPSQIVAIHSEDIKRDLLAVIRIYESVVNLKKTTIYEYWDDNFLYVFYEDDGIKAYNKFENDTNVFKHSFKSVPFIEFKNNNLSESDLNSVKSLIDVYDKVFSGFVNDIEDIQQVILVLTNYGGEDLQTFLSDLKRYKAIDMQKDSDDNSSGVSTMSIDIPIEARQTILDITRKQIFVSGQGVDPQFDANITASGIAIKHLYGLLDLKCGLMETEFRAGFNKLIRVVLDTLDVKNIQIIDQTYTRAYIQNDIEQAEVLAKLAPFTSVVTLAKNNPLVDDFEVEIKHLKGETHGREN